MWGRGKFQNVLYNKFVEASLSISSHIVMMVTPAKFVGESKLNNFRNKLLYSGRIRELIIYSDGKALFNGVTTGKVCYYLYDIKYDGKTNVTYIHGNKISSTIRDLRDCKYALPNNNMHSIIKKIGKCRSIVDIYQGQIFGIRTNDIGDIESEHTIKVLSNTGIINVDRSRICKIELLDKYKVYISHAISEHGGDPDKDGKYKIVARHGVLKPNNACTDTYLVLGIFKDSIEALNYHKYVTTKFYRALMLVSIGGVYLGIRQFSYIPMQDFTCGSDIDWNKNISEIDRQLYNKYNLSLDEVDYIESTIKPME